MNKSFLSNVLKFIVAFSVLVRTDTNIEWNPLLEDEESEEFKTAKTTVESQLQAAPSTAELSVTYEVIGFSKTGAAQTAALVKFTGIASIL